MTVHRGLTRREGSRPGSARLDSSIDPEAARSSVDEGLYADQSVLPIPAGFGEEDSTTSTSMVLLDEYTVPPGSIGRLKELSLAIPADGVAQVSVAGVVFGPFTGQLDVTIPLTDGVLTPGYSVRVHHRSTTGASVTTRATVVVLEV